MTQKRKVANAQVRSSDVAQMELLLLRAVILLDATNFQVRSVTFLKTLVHAKSRIHLQKTIREDGFSMPHLVRAHLFTGLGIVVKIWKLT